ncbi:hypothetical protein [Polaromonas sp. YR568]|uniref:hypothetical protein n=1 Tax=Polaromonas sp. YR568 TaxID=1855301 RepID=UPI00398BEF4E
MEGILFLIFVVIFLVLLVLGPLLGYTYLCRPVLFMEHVFPKNRPAGIFFSKKKGDGDRLVLYYGARLFLASLVAIVVVLLLQSHFFNHN